MVHVGDVETGPGGIATVIRNHLERSMSGIAVSAIASADPSKRGGFDRLQVFRRARRDAMALMEAQSDLVLHVHVSQRLSLLREGYFCWLARRMRVPCIVTIHGSRTSVMSGVSRQMMIALLRMPTVVHGFDDTYRRRFRVSVSNWRTLPNDLRVAQPRHARGNVAVFAYVGEVGLRKGVDRVLDAWRQVERGCRNGARLIIIGPLAKDFSLPSTEELTDLGVSHLGELSHREVLDTLTSVDVLLQPPRGEAFPMAVCEALAAGCAVIGTEVGGMGALLKNAAQLTTTGDPQDLSTKIEWAILNRSRIEELGGRGFVYAKEILDTEVVSAQWRSIYTEALASMRGVRE